MSDRQPSTTPPASPAAPQAPAWYLKSRAQLPVALVVTVVLLVFGVPMVAVGAFFISVGFLPGIAFLFFGLVFLGIAILEYWIIRRSVRRFEALERGETAA